jgi:hypothetical protein
MKRELGVVRQGNITSIRGLSDLEYEEYKKAVEQLLRFSDDNQSFVIVWLNYTDYEKLLKRYFEEWKKNASMSWGRLERMALEINRHVLNYLSSVRTFLDHSETNLKRRYGRNSERAKHFKSACSEAWNGNFSYRFLSALRNYAQHCGMPLGQLSLHSEEVSPDSKEVRHSLAVRFNRDELLGKYDKWGSRLKREIQKLPASFEINPHLAEMMKCLEKIHLTLLMDELPSLTKSADCVKNFVRQTNCLPGTPCVLVPRVLEGSARGEVKKLEMQIEWIPFHLVDMIAKIEAQLASSK